MKKVIFIDVDGTLRNDHQEISERTRLILKKVKSAGYEPILCTGRSCGYAKKLNDSIGSQYIIYNNGAGIYDGSEKKILYENPINEESILQLYDLANHESIRFILASNGLRYVNKLKHQDGSEVLLDEPLDMFLQKHKVVAVNIDSTDFEVLYQMRNQIDQIANIKIENQHRSLIDPNFPRTGTLYYDIVAPSSSKGNAIKYFCDMFHIAKENRIAIGDGYNDMSMFDECGVRVAMENALAALKERADYITDDNNHDGVAHFLEEYFKLNC